MSLRILAKKWVYDKHIYQNMILALERKNEKRISEIQKAQIKFSAAHTF